MNAFQALELTERKNNAIKNITEVIYRNITNKIKFAAVMGQKRIGFDVPMFVESYPVVDYGLLIRSVCEKLRKNNYLCARITEKSILISWEKAKQKKQKK